MICRRCGTEYYNANFCPRCGLGNAPNHHELQQNQRQQQPPAQPPQRPETTPRNVGKGCLTAFLITLGIIFLLIVVVLLDDSASSPATSQAGAPRSASTATAAPEIAYINVASDDLITAFNENEVAADQTYKGKMVRITGTVGSIGSGTFGGAHVLLKNDVIMFSFSTIQCNFGDSNLDAVANLREGDDVTITGKCTGINMFNIVITNCKVE